jgi:hypothetical protein
MAQCPSMEIMQEWFVLDETSSIIDTEFQQSAAAVLNNDYNVCDLHATFCSTVGGLRPQVDEIVRRVLDLDGRVLKSAAATTPNGSGDSGSSANAAAAAVSASLDEIRRQEMQGLLELWLHPIKGKF